MKRNAPRALRPQYRNPAASLLRQYGAPGARGSQGSGSTADLLEDHAGNLDNKDLIAASTMLFIPVHVPGRSFEVGDGHAGQGNGEADITALETFLTGTFRFIVHKDQHLLWPRAETPTSYISMGFSPDLKDGDGNWRSAT